MTKPKTTYTAAELKKLYPQSKGRGKYNATRCEIDGISFDSKKEASYYLGLKLRQQAGDILYFLRQVPFHLPGNTKYRVDFMVVEKGGGIRYVDVKGFQTKEFIRAKKQVEALYPVIIELA